MSGVFDRIREELDQLGDKVSGALEQGKLHIEKSNVLGLRNDAARELGMLTWRKTGHRSKFTEVRITGLKLA